MDPQAEEGSHEIVVMTFSGVFHVSVNRLCQDAPPAPTAVGLG
jgi:hypothetical protein